MDTFWEFCSGVRDKPKVKRTVSPLPTPFYDCEYLFCVSSTQKLDDSWKTVKIKKRTFYLCSQYCWEQWLDTPKHVPCSPNAGFSQGEVPPPPLSLSK